VRLSPKWFWESEVQERHYINPVAQHQLVFRSHLHRELPAGWEVSGGMCLFLQSPHNPRAAVKLMVPELRPHVELAYRQRLKRINIDQRYRMEARFFHQTNAARTELEDGYAFNNFRFRWRIQGAVPLWKIDNKRSLRVRVSNELHVNLGRKIQINVFDQNRIYGGFSVDFLPNLSFDVGYMNWFQQKPDGNFLTETYFGLPPFTGFRLAFGLGRGQ